MEDTLRQRLRLVTLDGGGANTGIELRSLPTDPATVAVGTGSSVNRPSDLPVGIRGQDGEFSASEREQSIACSNGVLVHRYASLSASDLKLEASFSRLHGDGTDPNDVFHGFL